MTCPGPSGSLSGVNPARDQGRPGLSGSLRGGVPPHSVVDLTKPYKCRVVSTVRVWGVVGPRIDPDGPGRDPDAPPDGTRIDPDKWRFCKTCGNSAMAHDWWTDRPCHFRYYRAHDRTGDPGVRGWIRTWIRLGCIQVSATKSG